MSEPLIQVGDFTLNSGVKSDWKLVADDFIKDNLDGLALLAWRLAGPFGGVEGVPRGGCMLAEALQKYVNKDPKDGLLILGSVLPLPLLIVEDVVTTGGSMGRLWQLRAAKAEAEGRQIVGVTVFARGPLPGWAKAVFPMPECFWLKREAP